MTEPNPTIEQLEARAAREDPEMAAWLRARKQRELNPPIEPMVIDTKAEIPALPAYAVLPDNLGVDACQWLDDYIDFSREWSPRSFDGYHEACGLFVLSTIAARRVKTEFGGPRYTPLFILLAGRSSLYAKTTAANLSISTLREAKLQHVLAPDQSTPQKFLSLLAGGLPDDYDSYSNEKKEFVRKRLALCGARGWFHEEFGTHVNAMMQPGGFMAEFRGILRKFDDTPETFESATISRNSEIINRPYLALMGNITPADLRKFAQKGSELWGDGFLARFAIVCPDMEEPRKIGRFPKGERYIPDKLLKPLMAWDERLGHASVEINAKASKDDDETTGDRLQITPGPVSTIPLTDQVTDCHYQYLDALGEISQAVNNQDLDANYVRFAEKALRIATLLASLSNAKRVDLNHWARAQQITERWRGGLHAIYDAVNDEKSKAREDEEKVLKVIARHGAQTAADVSRYIRGMGASEARLILDGLVAANMLETSKGARAVKYGLPSEQ